MNVVFVNVSIMIFDVCLERALEPRASAPHECLRAVEKLAKAKYQDNLEFIQWLKRYYDLNCGERGNNYKPEERRGNVVVDFSFAEKNVVPKTYNGSGAVVKSQTYEKKKVAAKVEVVAPKKPTTVTSAASSSMNWRGFAAAICFGGTL